MQPPPGLNSESRYSIIPFWFESALHDVSNLGSTLSDRAKSFQEWADKSAVSELQALGVPVWSSPENINNVWLLGTLTDEILLLNPYAARSSTSPLSKYLQIPP